MDAVSESSKSTGRLTLATIYDTLGFERLNETFAPES